MIDHDDYIFADDSDVCIQCGRFKPDSDWDGECPRCEPRDEEDKDRDGIPLFVRPMGVIEAESKIPARSEPRESRLRATLLVVGFALLLVVAGAGSLAVSIAERIRSAVRRLARRRRVRLEPDVLDALSRRVSRRPRGMLH